MSAQPPNSSALPRETILHALDSAPAALEIVAQYYPANRIPVKTQYLVEGLFEEGRV